MKSHLKVTDFQGNLTPLNSCSPLADSPGRQGESGKSATPPKTYLKYHVTSMVCQASGGPEKYTGRGMKESHQHLNITENEWKAMLADFRKVLDKFKVPEPEQKELIAIVESTKKDIVLVSAEMRKSP